MRFYLRVAFNQPTEFEYAFKSIESAETNSTNDSIIPNTISIDQSEQNMDNLAIFSSMGPIVRFTGGTFHNEDDLAAVIFSALQVVSFNAI